jgi:hypothetical protein
VYSGFLKEPTLLALAYDLEQAIKPRTQPQFLWSVPPEPPDAGICATLTAAAAPKLVNGRAKTSHHIRSGKPFIQWPAQRIAAANDLVKVIGRS